MLGLKSRKIGFTTAGLARALHVATFRSYSRSHLFSYRDDAAIGLIERVKFAHARLPEELKLPIVRSNDHEIHLAGYRFTHDEGDVRVIKAYPTTEDVSADEVCDFALIDEAARISRFNELYAAIEPTLTDLLLVISSGRGPEGDFAETWRAAKSGDIRLAARFYPYTARTGRDQSWRQAKMDEYAIKEVARREYPETEDDAFLGLEEYVFAGWSLDRAKNGAVGLRGRIDGHDYITFWDIGRTQDAAVGLVLDVTDRPVQVVGYRRLERTPYPALQAVIATWYTSYGGRLFIEENAAGLAVAENLTVPCQTRFTSTKSKPEMIENLKKGLEQGDVKWRDVPQLDREMRGYKWADKGIVQDSVIALAGAYLETRSSWLIR